MRKGVCPKCASQVILEGLRVLDRGEGHVEDDLAVAAYRKPAAWVWKGQVTSSLWACVCAACGYTELYAENPTALAEAVAEALACQAPGTEPSRRAEGE